jgi:hypothetical protein
VVISSAAHASWTYFALALAPSLTAGGRVSATVQSLPHFMNWSSASAWRSALVAAMYLAAASWIRDASSAHAVSPGNVCGVAGRGTNAPWTPSVPRSVTATMKTTTSRTSVEALWPVTNATAKSPPTQTARGLECSPEIEQEGK